MSAVAVVLSASVDSAVVEAVVAVLLVLLQAAEGRERPAHKLLRPLVVLQVAVVGARVPPQPPHQ